MLLDTTSPSLWMQELHLRANIFGYWYLRGLKRESDTKLKGRCNQQHLKAFRTVNEKQRHGWNDKLELSAPAPRSWVTDGFSQTPRQHAFKIWARTSEPEVVNITRFKNVCTCHGSSPVKFLYLSFFFSFNDGIWLFECAPLPGYFHHFPLLIFP